MKKEEREFLIAAEQMAINLEVEKLLVIAKSFESLGQIKAAKGVAECAVSLLEIGKNVY